MSIIARPGTAASSEDPPKPAINKDASHAAFYAGFGKGMMSAFDGLVLFISSKNIQSIFWELLAPIRNAQILYLSTAILLVLLLRDPADDLNELFWTLSRWGRIVTVLSSFVLERSYKANSAMFYAALKEINPEFGAYIESKEKAKTSLRFKFNKFKRVTKLTLFKMTGAIVNKLLPGGKYLAIPAVKFVSMKPVLGTPVAAAVSAIHVIPADILESSRVDDVLVSLGEAVIDADDLGTDITKSYSRTLEEAPRKYFYDRYRGYLSGCGFVYSLFTAVPFLGIPMTLIAECGAACVVADIVKRNLDKDNRKQLVGEENFKREKTS